MDHSDKEFPVIFAQAGELQGQRWILKKELMIGREPDCDIIIPDRQVSRHHARFTLDSKGALVEDLGSKNGTYCNGAQIVEPSSLSDGDLISIAMVARNTLIDLTWGEDEAAGVSEQAFDALVRRLRDRIAQIDPEHEYILTIRGHGMRLDNPQKTSP